MNRGNLLDGSWGRQPLLGCAACSARMHRTRPAATIIRSDHHPNGEIHMLDEALRALRLDSRLTDRRGWIARKDLVRALSELPDVSDKAAPPEPAPGESASEPA